MSWELDSRRSSPPTAAASEPVQIRVVTDLVRRGIYALPVAGALTAVPWFFILGNPSAKEDPDGYARGLASAAYAFGGYLYLAGLISLLFGLLALYAYLARTRASSWAGAGMIASVLGIALALPAFGITRLGDTVLADIYLDGHRNLSAAMGLLPDLTVTYRTTAYFGLFVVVSLLGAVAYGVAIWKSGSLPRWAGVLVAAGFGLSMTLSPGLAWVGALCLLIGGLWLARSVGQAPSAG